MTPFWIESAINFERILHIFCTHIFSINVIIRAEIFPRPLRSCCVQKLNFYHLASKSKYEFESCIIHACRLRSMNCLRSWKQEINFRMAKSSLTKKSEMKSKQKFLRGHKKNRQNKYGIRLQRHRQKIKATTCFKNQASANGKSVLRYTLSKHFRKNFSLESFVQLASH